jgi:hypothetical protein
MVAMHPLHLLAVVIGAAGADDGSGKASAK